MEAYTQSQQTPRWLPQRPQVAPFPMITWHAVSQPGTTHVAPGPTPGETQGPPVPTVPSTHQLRASGCREDAQRSI